MVMFGMCANMLWFRSYNPWLDIIHSHGLHSHTSSNITCVGLCKCLGQQGNDAHEARRKSCSTKHGSWCHLKLIESDTRQFKF